MYVAVMPKYHLSAGCLQRSEEDTGSRIIDGLNLSFISA